MFSQVSVCLQGVSIPLHAGIHTPPGPEADNPPRADPPCPVHAGIHPPVQCMLGYGQQTGCTHPTGMHSCLE